MTGRYPIVLVTANHNYHEHPHFESARQEAERLAKKTMRPAVVYMPVAIVMPPRGVTTELLPLDRDVLDLHDESLPF